MAPPNAIKKQRNNSIDFWRIFATICIAMCHFNSGGFFYSVDWITQNDLFTLTADGCPPIMYGALILEIFLFIGGYFMIASFKGQQRKGITAGMSPAKQAWKYTAGHFKVFGPVIFFGYLFAIVAECIFQGYDLRQWFYAFSINALDLLGLGQIGFLAKTNAAGAAVGAASGMNQVMFSDSMNFTLPWASNFPLWYLAALLVMYPMVYYLLASDEDKFKGFWAPLLVLLWGATFAFTDFGDFAWLNNRADIVSIGIPINVMWVTGGTCMGALLYYFVDFLKKKEPTPFGVRFLTGLNIVCSVWMIYAVVTNVYQWMGPQGDNGLYVFNGNIYIVPTLGVLLCNFLNLDHLTHLMNQPIFGKLGNYMLYWFAMHHPLSKIIPLVFTSLHHNYVAMVAIYLATTSVAGWLLQLVCEKFAMPLLSLALDEPKPKAVEKANPAMGCSHNEEYVIM